MSVIVNDLDIDKHLASVLAIGRRTPEFAVGERVLFWPNEILTGWRSQEKGALLVALDQRSGVLVGFLLSTFLNNKIATVENIYVEQSARRKGIASVLLDAFEHRARDAGMRAFRSFVHISNDAMSHLLMRRGYGNVTRTHWCSCRPDAITSRRTSPPEMAGSVVRFVQMEDIDATWLAGACDRGLANGTSGRDHHSGPLLPFECADVLAAVFQDESPIGLLAVSIHEGTSKATIESIISSPSISDPVVADSLLTSAMKAIAGQNIQCVTAHPVIGKTELLERLVSLGFIQHRPFLLCSKMV